MLHCFHCDFLLLVKHCLSFCTMKISSKNTPDEMNQNSSLAVLFFRPFRAPWSFIHFLWEHCVLLMCVSDFSKASFIAMHTDKRVRSAHAFRSHTSSEEQFQSKRNYTEMTSNYSTEQLFGKLWRASPYFAWQAGWVLFCLCCYQKRATLVHVPSPLPCPSSSELSVVFQLQNPHRWKADMVFAWSRSVWQKGCLSS